VNNISLRTNIETLSLYNGADERQLPSWGKYTPTGGKVNSHLKQLYRKSAEFSIMELFVGSNVNSEALLSQANFERQCREVRDRLKKLAQRFPDDRELFGQVGEILEDNQENIRHLNKYRNALIGA